MQVLWLVWDNLTQYVASCFYFIINKNKLVLEAFLFLLFINCIIHKKKTDIIQKDREASVSFFISFLESNPLVNASLKVASFC